jgi:hypothetical protein
VLLEFEKVVASVLDDDVVVPVWVVAAVVLDESDML